MPPMSFALMWGMPYIVRRISAEKPVAPGAESVSLSALFVAGSPPVKGIQDAPAQDASSKTDRATPAVSFIAVSPAVAAFAASFYSIIQAGLAEATGILAAIA